MNMDQLIDIVESELSLPSEDEEEIFCHVLRVQFNDSSVPVAFYGDQIYVTVRSLCGGAGTSIYTIRKHKELRKVERVLDQDFTKALMDNPMSLIFMPHQR